jgi:hypothetical protein
MALDPFGAPGGGPDYLALLRALIAQGGARTNYPVGGSARPARSAPQAMPPEFIASVLSQLPSAGPRTSYPAPRIGSDAPFLGGQTGPEPSLPMVPTPGPTGESHASAPFTRVPGRRYSTYASQAGQRVRPGQQLRFTQGLGYWAGPQVGGYHPYQPLG